MPDLVTHFGTTYLLFRPLPWRIDVRLIFLGALLPDLPWIANRVLESLTPLDPISLFAYLVPFSTPLIVVLVAVCLAMFHSQPMQCFGILGTAGLVHIGLDTLQTRPADGPVLLYPFSFRQYSLQWIWPEDIISYVAVGGSAVCIAWAMMGASRPTPFRWHKLGIALPLLLAICLLPLFTREHLIAENAYTLGFASEPEKWEGKQVILERDAVVATNLVQVSPGPDLQVQIMGALELQPGEQITVSGYYRDGKIYPEMIHRHRRGLRDLFSYTALLIFVLVWFDIPRRFLAQKYARF